MSEDKGKALFQSLVLLPSMRHMNIASLALLAVSLTSAAPVLPTGRNTTVHSSTGAGEMRIDQVGTKGKNNTCSNLVMI